MQKPNDSTVKRVNCSRRFGVQIFVQIFSKAAIDPEGRMNWISYVEGTAILTIVILNAVIAQIASEQIKKMEIIR